MQYNAFHHFEQERFLDFNHFGPKEETTIVDSIVIGAERMRRPRTPEQMTSDWLMSPMPPSPELDFSHRTRRTPFNPFELCDMNRGSPYSLGSIPQISPKSSPSWSPERHTPEPREATPPTDDKLRHKPWITENILGKISFTTQQLVVRSNFKFLAKLIHENFWNA